LVSNTVIWLRTQAASTELLCDRESAGHISTSGAAQMQATYQTRSGGSQTHRTGRLPNFIVLGTQSQ